MPDKKINKESFEFVNFDERIHDKALKTKQIGYIKDASIRFAKNKLNIFAFVVLIILIMMSILIPITTSKNFKESETHKGFLPPRIPLLEKLGIADGISHYDDLAGDLHNKDEATGLYFPKGFEAQFVVPGSVTNDIRTGGALIHPDYVGGEVQLFITSGTTITYKYNQVVELKEVDNPTITFEVTGLTTGVNVDVMIGAIALKNITSPGIYNITVFDEYDTDIVLSGVPAIRINAVAGSQSTYAEIKSYQIDVNEEEQMFIDGYTLATLEADNKAAAKISRSNALFIRVSFSYYSYKAVFRDFEISVFEEKDLIAFYDQFPGMEESKTPDPDNPGGYIFGDGFPIKKIIFEHPPFAGPTGVVYRSFKVLANGVVFHGYDSLPYFFFGTNNLGQDMFALVFLGLRTSLIIGVLVSIVNILIGVVYGAVSGYYGGTTDLLMERFAELWSSFPQLAIIAIITSIVGPGSFSLFLILTYAGWTGIAAITRMQFYRFKGREYVLASRTLGASDSRLIFKHILPNGIGTIITRSVLSIPFVIFSETTLAYLGFGIGHGQELEIFGLKLTGLSLGVILADGYENIHDKQYLVFFPALVIAILMITFNIFGNGLRDALNPTLRGVEE